MVDNPYLPSQEIVANVAPSGLRFVHLLITAMISVTLAGALFYFVGYHQGYKDMERMTNVKIERVFPPK